MLDITKILVDGGILTAMFLIFVLLIAKFAPRTFLNKNDVPADILAAVPPRTPSEKRQAGFLAIPLFIILIGGTLYSTYTFQLASGAGFLFTFLHALIIVLMIATADLVLIDWLLLNTLTPKFVVFPGTEGFAGYKDYVFHGRAHLKVLPAQIIGSAVCAALVLLLT